MKRMRYAVVMLIAFFMMTQFCLLGLTPDPEFEHATHKIPMPFKLGDQPSDTFDITVTGEYLWINVTNTTWAIGTVSMGTSAYTNNSLTFIAVKDNCSVATDFKLQITSDAATWSAATAGNPPNTDVYRLNATINTTDDPPQWETEYQIVTASTTTVNTSIPAAENETFDLRFDVPTSTSTGSQQSITVTASVTKS